MHDLDMYRYYTSQQLMDKSDVYSFGVILFELISGREAISNESFGMDCRNIVHWVSQLTFLFGGTAMSTILAITLHTCKNDPNH